MEKRFTLYLKAGLFFIVCVAAIAPLFGQEKRVALVIGNGAYEKIQSLTNPANDGADMTAALERLGFTVLSGMNADRRTMRSRIDDFNRAIQGASMALFYYAGHGVQLDGENYLVPVNAEVAVPGDVAEECVPLSRVTARMNEAGAGTNILILDACRDNPFKAVTRGIGRGLAVIGHKPPESIIVYATAENEKAEDGTGRNGVFTAALLRHIERKEAFTDILLDVKAEVRAATADKQRPANYDNLTRKVYLAEPGPARNASPPAGPSAAGSRGADAAKAAEELKRGIDLYYGLGVKEDRDKAGKHLELAAELGSARARFQLAMMYLYGKGDLLRGEGKGSDLNEALKRLRRAAEEGSPQAQWYLGAFFKTGDGGHEKNEAEAKRWFEGALSRLSWMKGEAEAGDRETIGILLVMYSQGFGVQKDEAEAKRWQQLLLGQYRKDAEGGSISAQITLAEMSLYGDGGAEPDAAEAAKWYRMAAEQGSPEAEFILGSLYQEGRGVPASKTEALKWWRRSAEHGYDRAQCRLGMLYIEGQDIKKNVEEGLRWYKMAAEQNSIEALLDLGDLYSAGRSVQKDSAEALKWYRKAADLNNIPGQFNVGRIYEEGTGIGRDYGEAAKWYLRAAEQGDAEAQFRLGALYEKGGPGLLQDYVGAHMWYNLAAAHLFDEEKRAEAEKNRETVAKKMPLDQLFKAQELAREWAEKHPQP